ncbi:MAG: SGNH/GDSL hydrolase family protein [Methanotrichaceae archaeon]|nr:SGNH/GDSL hydrolase family protein [Methanotrichaceae archaeon]
MNRSGRTPARTVSLLSSDEKAVIVAFGDSITAGYAVRRGFPHFWREALVRRYPSAKIELHNEGVSGNTSFDGLARLGWSVLPHRPDLVTMNFGINDAAYGISIDEFSSNIVEMAETIMAECGSEVILLSSQPLLTPGFNDLVLKYYHALEAVSSEMDLGYVDVYGAWMRRAEAGVPLESLILSGLDHPNEAGYRIIAEELMKLF